MKYLGTFKNHPLAGLTLRDSYSFATTTQQGQTVITGINTTKDQLVVSVGTNLSNTYKELVDGKAEVKTDDSSASYAERKSYKTESWNYNPSYNQNMGSSDEKNKNEEFMWCANLVETMPMSDMVSDLNSGATTDVSVEAWCDTPAYTQARTNKYGLTKGERSTLTTHGPRAIPGLWTSWKPSPLAAMCTCALIAIPQPRAYLTL